MYYCQSSFLYFLLKCHEPNWAVTTIIIIIFSTICPSRNIINNIKQRNMGYLRTACISSPTALVLILCPYIIYVAFPKD